MRTRTAHHPKPLSHLGQARKQVAFLRRFKRDWATTAYLRRSFQNRRGYLRKQANELVDENGAGPSGTHRVNDDDDDDDIDIDEDLAQEADQDDFMDGSEGDDEDEDEGEDDE